MNNSNHQALGVYLKYVEEHFNIHICINDFVGFIPLDKPLDIALQPYMAHTNPFCMYVKSDKRLMQKCQSMKNGILAKCIKKGAVYYGMCHAGAGELIYPIFYSSKLLGVINVGMFRTSDKLSTYLIDRLCRHSGLNPNKAVNFFDKSMMERFNEKKEEELHANINFLCSYLSNCFSRLSIDYHAAEHLKKKHNSSEDFILSHCIQYIKENFKENIKVSDLVSLCHCSESYINHIFKKRTSKSIKNYVNNLRIEDSKKLLTDTSESISSIALKAGFQDPDYFSRVFTAMVGVSPRIYRERFK
jgi:AraC-like DNA-binding protein